MLKLILKIIETTVEAVSNLDKLVSDLVGERKSVKEYAEKINQLEHDVDLLNIKLRENLQKTEYDVNFFTIFTVGNIFDILEAISDSIEGVADYIIVLLTSSRVL